MITITDETIGWMMIYAGVTLIVATAIVWASYPELR
jgi:hypothetical protein